VVWLHLHKNKLLYAKRKLTEYFSPVGEVVLSVYKRRKERRNAKNYYLLRLETALIMETNKSVNGRSCVKGSLETDAFFLFPYHPQILCDCIKYMYIATPFNIFAGRFSTGRFSGREQVK